MALDEPRDSDSVFDIDGFTFIADKDFMEKAKPVKIDFMEYGFKLTSSLVFDMGCSSCSTTGNHCD